MIRGVLAVFLIACGSAAAAVDEPEGCPKGEIVFVSSGQYCGPEWELTFKTDPAEERDRLTYRWSVSETTKITSGQGTHTIKATTPPGQLGISLTLEVAGLPKGCESTFPAQRSCCEGPPLPPSNAEAAHDVSLEEPSSRVSFCPTP
jgi:PKD-like domain